MVDSCGKLLSPEFEKSGAPVLGNFWKEYMSGFVLSLIVLRKMHSGNSYACVLPLVFILAGVAVVAVRLVRGGTGNDRWRHLD